MEGPGLAVHDFNEEEQDYNVSGKGINKEQSPLIDKLEKKSSTAGVFGDTGAEVQKMLKTFREDIHSILLEKRRNMEMFTKDSVQDSRQKMEQLWKTHQKQRHKVNTEFSEKFASVFQRWDIYRQKVDEKPRKLTEKVKKQQKIFEKSTANEKKDLMAIKKLYKKYLVGLDHLENESLLLAQKGSELKKEVSLFKKKLAEDIVNYISRPKLTH